MELRHSIQLADDLYIRFEHNVHTETTWVSLVYMDKIVFQMPFSDFKELVKNIQSNIDTFEVICEEFHRVIK